MEHPGRRIQHRFLEPLGINGSQLAVGLGVNRSTVSRLLAGLQPITPAMAARLGAYFQVPARWFLQMQADYDAAVVECSPEMTAGVSPLDIDPDWMLTPDGALSLSAPQEPPPDAEVRTVQLDNGAVALVGGSQ